MILKNIAEIAGVDISTVSRITCNKYVQTPFGTILLKSLFSEGIENKSGAVISNKVIQKEIEDPLKQIEMMIDGYVDKVFVNHRFHKILHRQISLQNSSELNLQIQSILMKNINEVKNIIETGIKKKVFRNVDVEFLIITFFGTVSQFANSSGLSLSLLNIDQSKHLSQIPEMKTRMKTYLIELFESYLLIKNEK